MNKTVLILSGPTHEYFDPVRFIGNASSGLMGKALAEEAMKRGYTVDFVSGPVSSSSLPVVEGSGNLHPVVSAEDMLAAAKDLFPTADAIIFAAAVADYAPATRQDEKMAKTDSVLVLHLHPTPDLARTLCAEKRPDQVAIGFALQTSDGETNARRKLEDKHLDGIVLNSPATLGAADGTFSFLQRGTDKFKPWGRIDKAVCARAIFDAIDNLRKD